jgi:rod shape-determining protein MreB
VESGRVGGDHSLNLLSKKIGIDLGTSTVLIYVKGEGIVVNEASLVAVNRDGTRILAIGRQALEMVGRTPDAIQVVRPMREGVIADFVVTEGMLHHFIGKVQGRQRIFKPEIMICVPSGVTSVERRAVTEAAISAGARQAWLIDEPLAAAIGAGLPIAEPRGNTICDIGGGTTEIAVISLSGMVVAHSIRVGGNRIDDAIATYLKRKHNLLIGERTAEDLKISAGSAVTMREPLIFEVKGRDLVSGLPRSLEVSSNEVVEAIQEPLRLIVGAVRAVLEETPPELAADIFDRGIVLSGGGAQLRGLDRYIAMHTGIPTAVANDPQTSVVRGTGLALENFEVLKRNQSYLR